MNMEEMSQHFQENDHFPRMMGMETLEFGPGYAKVAMNIRADMVNYHGFAHGGTIFALADTAFGLACNSYGVQAVGLTLTIDHIASVFPGERLIAEARERNRTNRTGNYLITVTTPEGKDIAFVRGIAYFKVGMKHGENR